MVQKFRKRPVTIEALQWTGLNVIEVIRFVPRGGFVEDNLFIIPTLEGDMTARPGDWIIKGVEGEFYPCKPDIFAKTYEEVNDD